MMFKLSKVRQAVLLAVSVSACTVSATEFNTDVLDAEDMQNVDMSQFSVAGYVPPGDYVLTVFVNGQRLGAPRDITVLAQHAICIPANLLDLIGLKDSAKQKVTLSEAGQCLDFSALTGVKSTVELSTLSLKITIPQLWMEYRDPNWTPPALWEEGVNGAFVDYSANASVIEESRGSKRVYLSTNGTTGLNLGAWRFRGDYNANYQKQHGGSNPQETLRF